MSPAVTGFLGYTSSLAFLFMLYFAVVVSFQVPIDFNYIQLFCSLFDLLCCVFLFPDHHQKVVHPLSAASQCDYTFRSLPGNNNPHTSSYACPYAHKHTEA